MNEMKETELEGEQSQRNREKQDYPKEMREIEARRECTESAEDKAARVQQMRARRRAESAEHRAARLEQMHEGS